MKDEPILYMPNIDWSDPSDVDRLFEKSMFSAFDNDPNMTGLKLSTLDDRIGMFHMVNMDRKMPQATLRHNLGQLPATRFNKLAIERGEELVDPTLAILMRVFDMYPNLCPPFPFVNIEVLMEKCGIESKRELSLLLGRDQVSATRYTAKKAQKQPSPTTMMLTYVMYMFNEAGRLDEYREIVHKEAKYRGSDNLVATGFPKVKPPGLDLVRLLKEKATKILKDPKSTETQQDEAQDIINKCIFYMGNTHDIRVTKVELRDFTVNYEALKGKDDERVKGLKEDIEFYTKQLAEAEQKEKELLEELQEISKTLK